MPVVDRMQRLVGIITRKDTLDELVEMRLQGEAAKRFTLRKQQTQMRMVSAVAKLQQLNAQPKRRAQPRRGIWWSRTWAT